jgi:hypothetical protein
MASLFNVASGERGRQDKKNSETFGDAKKIEKS